METGAPDVTAILVIFPLFFAAIWLGVTWLIGWVSGWFDLMRRFPDRMSPTRATFSWRSGYMGRLNSQFRGALTLSAHEQGLRVSLFWPFAAFSKPFFVPWDQISVAQTDWFLFKGATLSFGRPVAGTLTVHRSTWDEIVKAAPRGAVRT